MKKIGLAKKIGRRPWSLLYETFPPFFTCNQLISIKKTNLTSVRSLSLMTRGVPAYTQSTQLRTLIFECQKNKIVLNREICNKKRASPGLGSLYTEKNQNSLARII